MKFLMIPLFFMVIIAWIVYMIALSDSTLNGNTIWAIYMTVNLSIPCVMLGDICYLTNKMNMKVQTGLAFLNQKLKD